MLFLYCSACSAVGIPSFSSNSCVFAVNALTAAGAPSGSSSIPIFVFGSTTAVEAAPIGKFSGLGTIPIGTTGNSITGGATSVVSSSVVVSSVVVPGEKPNESGWVYTAVSPVEKNGLTGKKLSGTGILIISNCCVNCPPLNELVTFLTAYNMVASCAILVLSFSSTPADLFTTTVTKLEPLTLVG